MWRWNVHFIDFLPVQPPGGDRVAFFDIFKNLPQVLIILEKNQTEKRYF